MKNRVPLLLLIIVLLAPPQFVSAAEQDWQPSKTWVFVVGLLEWKDGNALPSFPKKGRRDSRLASFFKEHGVPATNIQVIQDSAATTGKVQAEFKKFLPRCGTGDTLFVYYCGHGYCGDDGKATYFATYDAGKTAWAVGDIFNAIEANYHGARAILLADCCASGALAAVAMEQKTKIEYACLASVQAGEESTGCWTFSDSVLDALEGQPQADLNGDGVITMDEAARYVKEEMSFFDNQISQCYISPGFSSNWNLATGKAKANKHIGEHVQVQHDEGWNNAQVVGFKDDKYKVRFASTAEREETWVEAAKMRDVPKSEPAKTYGAANALALGASVKVEWERRWYPAKILKINAEKKEYLITYEGYDEEWNEWVPAERIRGRN